MAKLDSNPTLSLHLDENRPFTYAHLVKFERPLKEWNAPNLEVLYSQKFTRYAYVTDASYAINFNDESTYEESGSVLNNGSQTYHPNKLISVSSVQDSAENKIANFTINIAANSLDAALYNQSLTFSISNGDYLITAGESFSDVGFVEGDLIRLKATPASESTADFNLQRFRIHSFRNEGKTIKVEEETFPFATWTETGESYDILQSSTELTALTLPQKAANFVNRQVSVYKAFFYEDEPDVFIGSPVLLFSGIIATANYKEDPNGIAQFSWVCRSHWGDFQQVRGRLGSDDFHRALNRNGRPNPDATVRPEYASDMGFQHANNAVNVIAIYTTTEERYKEVWRNKFFGTKKLKKYEVEVENEVDLRFNLNATYIPVVYGVRRVGGNPIFADLENNSDADTVYIAESLAEGPIQSILNVYVDDQPLVCISQQDFDVRNFSGASFSSDAVDIACYGRADKGDVILGEYTVDPSVVVYSGSQTLDVEDYEALEAEAEVNAQAAQALASWVYNPPAGIYVERNQSYNGLINGLYSSGVPVGQKGLIHDYGINFTQPTDTIIEFKAGLEDQEASSRLSSIANSTKFKLQNDYFGSAPATNYWGANHKLLDTAYTVSKHTITPDQTTVPDIDYVVKGKLVESYNYDGSYGHVGSEEDEANFSLGETVTIKKFSDDSALASNVQIIDKWVYQDGKGNTNYRFRWDLTAAQEISLQQAKKFYMEDGSANKWTMTTYDFTEGNATFTIETKLEDEITTITSSGSSDINATTGSSNVSTAQNATGVTRASINTERTIPIVNGFDGSNPKSPTYQRNPVTSSTTVTDPGNGSTTLNDTPTNNISTVTGNASTTTYVTVKNQIKLSTTGNPSSVDDAYNGKAVLIRRTDFNGNIIETLKVIKDYDGATRILTLTTDLADGEVPEAGDEVLIYGNEEGRDVRSTTNFGLILLDYMKSKRYGAGLSDDKLNINSFLQAARTCDTRSDITLTASTASSISVGDKFEYNPAGGFKWQGTIKELTNISGNDYKITFTDCIGKLTNKTNPARTFTTDDIIWSPDAGLSIQGGSTISSFNITRVGTAATLTIDSPTTGNVLDYSLYDSDFIQYWKYLGWDSPDQRWVTRHQGNLSIDTSQPVFNVIGVILEHFNGILAFEDGKFTLSVETKRDADGELFWNFQDSSEGWTRQGASIIQEEEYITLDSSGTNPIFRKSNLSFKGSENLIIRARIRRTGGTSWQGAAFYTTDSHVESSQYKKDISDPTVLNEWVIASWDMSNLTAGGTDWEDNYITGLRLDLGLSSADDFDIEWVSVGSSVRVIEQEDIIGSLSIKDDGLSKAYNSLSASIIDPQNNFNSRNVSFFNSDYLKQDRGVVRSGSFKLEGITNYYNARLAVEQILNRSRFSRQISFTVRPIGLALSPGELIRVKYPRFGWDSGKYFRIQSLTYQTNCLVSVVATEHDDSIYFIDAPKASPFNVPLEVDAVIRRPSAPQNVAATGTGNTNEQTNQITVTWDNVAKANGYEIWRSISNDVNTAVKIADQASTLERSYIDILTPTTRTTYYYWVRAFTRTTVQTTRSSEQRDYYSDYSSSATGTTIAKFNNAYVNIYQRSTNGVSAPTLPSNTPSTYTFSTGGLSPAPNEGWSTTIPSSGGEYLWQVSQFVESITDTASISAWDAASLLATDGQTGASVDIVFIRSATNPGAPSTSSPTTENPPWYTNPPSGTELLWASKGQRATGGTTFTYGDPYQVEGSAVVEVAIYKKDDTNTPTGGSYNFTTNSLNTSGLTSGWSQTPPATLGNLESVYKSVGLFVGGPEETAATTTWSPPAVIGFRQDGSIGNDARTVKLTPSSYVVNYSTAGVEIGSPNQITFTTAVQSISGSPNYRFLVDGTEKQNTTTSTFTLADADEPAIGEVVEVSVEVYDTTPSPDELLATDSVSIYAVQDGSDAIIGLLTNSAHTVSAGYDGTVSSFTGSGGTFKVFVGGTEVTTSCTFSVVGTPASTTTTINSSTGVYDITALSANQDNVTYQAVIPAATAGTSGNVTITAIYSISKSIKGTSISTVSKSNETVTVTFEDGTTDTFTVNGVASVVKSGTQLTITYDDGTTSTIDDGEPGNGIASVVKNGQTVTVTYDDSTTNTFNVEDAIQGDPDYVTVANITKNSDGTYSANELDVDFTFRQLGTVVAKRRYRLARDADSWGALTTRDADIGDELNVSQLTASVSIDNQNAVITVQYDDGAGTPTVLSVATAQASIVFDGLGISSVAKVNETVTVTYDNATTDTFTVNGVASVVKSGTQLTITYDDGTTSTIDDGEPGNGIASVVKNGQTVTVTYDDSTTNTFNVEDAIQGDPDYVTVANITRATDGTTYSATFLDVDFTFRQVGTVVAKRRYRLTRSGDSWGALTTRDADIGDELNTGQLTDSVSVSGQDAVITVQYDDGATTPTVLSVATAPVSITLSGTTPVKGVDYDDGDPGLRTIQGYLYYEKTTANAPSAPSGNTYTFSTGVVTGTGIGTGVDTWTNEPRPQDPTSSNTHYTVRYSGTEASASSSTIAVTYSSVVQYTNFTGVVTFSNGTFSDGPTAIDGTTDATSIDGGNIKTNSITANEIQISREDGSGSGIWLDYNSGSPRIRIFQGTTERVTIGYLS